MKKPLVIDGGVRWAPVDEAYRDFPAARTEDRRAICRACGRPSHTVDGRSPHAWRQPAAEEQPTLTDFVKLLGIGVLLAAAAYMTVLAGWANGWPS